jgi:hypothetical protein
VNTGTPAVLFDVDGTLALMGKGEPGKRTPFDWARVGEDTPNHPVLRLVRIMRRANYAIVFMSGRDEVCWEQTWAWLREWMAAWPGDLLVMRPAGDMRPDEVVKAELYHTRVVPEFEVEYVFDDRNKVVAMWRNLGLTCLQVADGDF